VTINTKRIGHRKRFVIGGDNRLTLSTNASITSEISKHDLRMKEITKIEIISTSSTFFDAIVKI
jgi:hypothetical protein